MTPRILRLNNNADAGLLPERGNCEVSYPPTPHPTPPPRGGKPRPDSQKIRKADQRPTSNSQPHPTQLEFLGDIEKKGIAVVTQAFAPRVEAQRGGPGGPPAPYHAARERSDRSHRPMGVARYRRLALPEVHAPKETRSLCRSTPPGKSRTPGTRPRDEAAGEQCKAYGAAASEICACRVRISVAGRRHPEGRDRRRDADATLPIRTNPARRGDDAAGERTQAAAWQGASSAPGTIHRPPSLVAAAGPSGWLAKVVTTRMRPGYLRRNGVPTVRTPC